MTTAVSAAHAKKAGILGADRAGQEKYLRKRGWDRLLDRADVWFNPYRPGTYKHDVFTFRAALEEETDKLIDIAHGRGPAPQVHHHAGSYL